MNAMTYKSFTWNINPDKIRVTHKCEPIYFEAEDGSVYHIGMGVDYCEITGSGAFSGPSAYEYIAALEAAYHEQSGGSLLLPDGTRYQVYMLEFNHSQNFREEYAMYEFTFRVTDKNGALYP